MIDKVFEAYILQSDSDKELLDEIIEDSQSFDEALERAKEIGIDNEFALEYLSTVQWPEEDE